MHSSSTIWIAVACLATALGCYGPVLLPRAPRPVVVQRPGPPPHAPAHGYRKNHEGAELRFDSGLGVYVVVGQAEVYFHDGWFLRFDGGTWVVSAHLDGPWEPRASAWVPPGLRAKHAVKNGGKERHRGHGPPRPVPAKGRW